MYHRFLPGWLSETVDIFIEKRVSRSAAELAYFLMLSFFPLLICINAFASLAADGDFKALRLLTDLVPQQSLEILNDYLAYIAQNQSPALLFGGLFLLFTSSSSAFRSLINIMDDIFERKSYAGLRHVIMSSVFSVAFLLAIYSGIVIFSTGGWFLSLVDRYFGIGERIESWRWARFGLLFLIFFLYLWLFYRSVAPKKHPRTPVLFGAAFSSFSLVAVSVLFSWFIGLSSRYALVYGSLASIIIMMIWLYLCGNIVILGNVLNFTVTKYLRARKL